MIISTILIALFASVAVCSDVIELTDSTFASGVKDKEIMLVEFFAPWCGHCKKLAPEYETAASKLIKEDPPIPLAKVDCTEAGKESCGKYGVSGYPTLKIFRNGELSKDYDGPRNAAGIIQYMKKQSAPSSQEINDLEKMKKKLDTMESALVVGFFEKDDELKTEFMKTANEMRDDYYFAHTTSEEILADLGHKDQVVIFRPSHLHSKLEPNKEVFTGMADPFYIKKFLKASVHGLVGHLTQDNEDQFKKPLCTVYFNVDFERNAKGTRYWRNRILKVATEFKNKVMTFAFASKKDFSRKLDTFGLSSDNDEVVVAIVSDDGMKYPMKEKFSVDTFRDYLKNYFEGNVEPFIKSEEVPETNDGPVTVVVGKTFNEIVNDETKDVLIEFYAPWCGHCKSLEPVYKELGEKLADVKDIVIAKMDATANDAPSPYEVSGFPTIYFSPMYGKKTPKKYNGGRDVDSFIDYLKREATKPFKVPDKKKKKKKDKKQKDEL